MEFIISQIVIETGVGMNDLVEKNLYLMSILPALEGELKINMNNLNLKLRNKVLDAGPGSKIKITKKGKLKVL